jgi:hypothetical protein
MPSFSQRKEVLANSWWFFGSRRLIQPSPDFFLDKRPDTAQLGERASVRHKLSCLFGPQEGAPRGAAKRARENASLTAGLSRKQLRNVRI